MRALSFLLLCCAAAGQAQDERRIVSPNGELEFRIFITEQPEDAGLTRLAYQVLNHGSLLVDTSFLGIDILNQEPVLGDNLGLMSSSSSPASDAKYNVMTVQYMQNGSLGRRLNVEVRAYDDGIAFRYNVPKSTPLEDLVIHDEATEFAFAQPAPGSVDTLPFTTRQPGGWIAITEIEKMSFPSMYLTRSGESILNVHLPKQKSDPNVVFEGPAPLTWPWRVLVIGFDREHLGQSIVLSDLKEVR